MAGELPIVNEDVQLELNDAGGTISGTVTVNPATSLFSSSVKTSGKRTFLNIGFNVTGATNGSVTNASGLGIITGNSIKSKADNQSFVLEDALVVVTLTGTLGSGTGSFPATVQIKNPGQDLVKGK